MALMLTQVLPLKRSHETALTTTTQPPLKCGQWNSGRGTRKELEESVKWLRKQVKREKAIWDRYAANMKVSLK